MNKKDKAFARQLLKSIYMSDAEIENELKNSTLKDIVQYVFYVRLGAAFLVGTRYLIALDAKKKLVKLRADLMQISPLHIIIILFYIHTRILLHLIKGYLKAIK